MICRILVVAAAILSSAPVMASEWRWSETDEETVIEMCKQAVLDRLVAPDSAVFGAFDLTTPPTAEKPTISVHVFSVSSQNVYGVVIPVEWSCMVDFYQGDLDEAFLFYDTKRRYSGYPVPTLPYRPYGIGN